MVNHLNLATYKQLADQFKPFTESETHLHEFIIMHFEELSYYGIIDLAQKAQTSKATIGRYLKKLGFTGYSAFKNALKQNQIVHNFASPIQAKKNSASKDHPDPLADAQRYISNVRQLIEQFSNKLDTRQLNELSHLIADKKRTVYVAGPASSRALAIHFSTLLKYCRSDVVILPLDKSELPKSLLGIKENDLLIVFSYYRFNPVVLDIAKFFNQNNAHVTVVTNTHSNPYGIFANMQFILPSNVDSIFQSRTIGFLFVELLLFLVQQKTENDDNFDELESLFKFFGTFSSINF